MIKDISNITNKSFDHFSSDDEFGLINIIFGVNGSGKSALTQWLKNNVPEKTDCLILITFEIIYWLRMKLWV